MLKPDDFEVFFNTHVQQELNTLEAKRKLILQRVTLIILSTVIGSIFLLFVGFHPALVILLGFAFTLIGGAVLTGELLKNLYDGYKEKIIKSLVNFIDEDLNYDNKSGVPVSEFVRSRIFSDRVSWYRSEDYVWGNIGDTDIGFSQVHAFKFKNKHYSETAHETIFKGLFFVGDFHKSFDGEVYILPNIAGKLLGGFGQLLQTINSGRPPVVRLENPEFNREFVVYGSDQIESRYILTPSMMERILEFRKSYPHRVFFISFIQGKLFVAIRAVKPLFEPTLFKPLNTFAHIKAYYSDLYLAVSIVEEFNLNTRIWIKE